MRGADEAAVADKVLVADRDAVAAGQADRVPAAVDVEEAEVLVEGEAFKGVGRVDDEVKGHLVRLVPALFARGQEAVGAHLLGVGLLGAGARNGPDFGAEGFGEEHAVVAQASDAYDADLFARAGAEALERAVYGDAGAEHGGCVGARQGIGNWIHPEGSCRVSRCEGAERNRLDSYQYSWIRV